MSYVETKVVTTVERVNSPVDGQQTQASELQCLIVSECLTRREMLMRAANEAGWDAIVCADPQNAIVESRRMVVQLALIDTRGHGGPIPEGFRHLCEHLSGRSRLLLAVCGREGDVQEEIWARQLGAWLYLPGIEDGDDIASLCIEASAIAKRSATPRYPVAS